MSTNAAELQRLERRQSRDALQSARRMNLESIVDRILAVPPSSHPTRVGIDGRCAAGKTSLAAELEAQLQDRGVSVIRASGDDFQNPPEVRWRRGRRSAEGFYRDTMDFAALRRELLDPLGPSGNLRYRTTVYDVFASRPNLGPIAVAQRDAVLLVDGLFLHAAAVRGAFELTLLVDTGEEVCLERALVRRQERLDDPVEIERLYRERYLPGWRLYAQEVQPMVGASIIVR